MESGTSVDERRILALDGLRGIAILLVLFFHFTLFGRLAPLVARLPPSTEASVGSALARVADAGWVGVDLFFVLSGALITRGLLAERTREGFLRRFYARRALRIFPLYYLVLALVASVFAAQGAPLGAFVWPLTYTTNLAMGFRGAQVVPGELNHLWSLAIEEQFYLLFPLLVLSLERRALAVSVGCGIVGALLFRIVFRSWVPLCSFLTPARIDGVLAGAWVAIAFAERTPRHERAARGLLAISGVVLSAFVVWRGGFAGDDELVDVYGRTLLVIFFAAVVAVATAASGTLPRLLAAAPLRFFGRYSYGIYLLHLPLLAVVFALHFGMRRFALATGSLLLGYATFVVLMTAIATAVAMVSYHLFEARFLALKRRFR